MAAEKATTVPAEMQSTVGAGRDIDTIPEAEASDLVTASIERWSELLDRLA